MPTDPRAAAIESVVGVAPRAWSPLSGGDICDAWRVELVDGRVAFVKQHHDGARMFEAEAAGLRWLREANAVRIPEVLGCGEGLLALEFIEAAAPSPAAHESLGRALAALHRAGAATFGAVANNFIASLAQCNDDTPRWAVFYGEHRLRALGHVCIERGRMPRSFAKQLDALIARLPSLCGPTEPPARLHGDLWSGNAMFDREGTPVLYDPAVYAGHREVDLAMMRMFGGFDARTFDAYDEAFPLAPEHEERVALYQLYPVLVHVALFGGGYASTAQRIVARYA